MIKIIDFLNDITDNDVCINLQAMASEHMLTLLPSNNVLGPRFLGYDGSDLLLVTVVTEDEVDYDDVYEPMRNCLDFVETFCFNHDPTIEICNSYGLVIAENAWHEPYQLGWSDRDIRRFDVSDADNVYWDIMHECCLTTDVHNEICNWRDEMAENLTNAIPQPMIEDGRTVPEGTVMIPMDVLTAKVRRSKLDKLKEIIMNSMPEEQDDFLSGIVGMEDFKQNIARLEAYMNFVNHVRHSRAKRRPDVAKMPKPSLVYVFLGDSGTGKTTVARQMGRKLKEIGLLSKGHCIELQRENLVGNCYGDEERLTLEALERSKGGVLFLDEAYRCFMNNCDKKDPGHHILETLMRAFTEEDRCIILAGYHDEMLELMKVNPGFANRIDDRNIVEFVTPSDDGLMDIGRNYLSAMGMSLDSEADERLLGHIRMKRREKGRNFGNARFVIRTIDDMIYQHAWNADKALKSRERISDMSELHASDLIDYGCKETRPRNRVGF